jgi:hypothetical protein
MANMFGWRSAASKDDAVMEELREIKEHLGIADRTRGVYEQDARGV